MIQFFRYLLGIDHDKDIKIEAAQGALAKEVARNIDATQEARIAERRADRAYAELSLAAKALHAVVGSGGDADS